MSEKNYPPLPQAECLGFGRLDDDIEGFTSDQMRAYVDADRAQRLPLTDEQCDAIAEALSHFYWSEVQTPSRKKLMRQAIRDALGDVVNKGETKCSEKM